MKKKYLNLSSSFLLNSLIILEENFIELKFFEIFLKTKINALYRSSSLNATWRINNSPLG
jgi:hypothetical protein